MSLNITQAQQALENLFAQFEEKTTLWNEAQVRFKFIDRFLKDCLGWPIEEIQVEEFEDGKFSDYELGKPRSVIWEAKKEGAYFSLPVNPQKNLIQDLQSIFTLDKYCQKAIKQVLSYCNKRGVQFAVICNGTQIIAFIANRVDGVPPINGNAFVINGHEQLKRSFPIVWQNLSRDGIYEKTLINTLVIGNDRAIPPKPSSKLTKYPAYRYKSDIQQDLATLSELLIEDIILSTKEIERQFYEECYCPAGALSRDALLSKSILQARYALLFKDGLEPTPTAPITNKKGDISLTQEVITEAIAKRPIVLLGDVGVGKTSFLKYLQYVSAAEEFSKSLYIYIDLGSQASLEANLKNFILAEIRNQLLDVYNIDVNKADFVRGIYNLDLLQFDNSLDGELKTSRPELYEERKRAFLDKKIQDPVGHIKKSIEHISKGQKRQVLIVIDNADQRTIEIQQDAFITANEFSKNWRALVFIPIRPQTFHHSKEAGTFSAYPHKLFTISPPRPDLVVKKRLDFALKVTEGKLPIEKLEGVNLNFQTMALFLKAVKFSLEQNREITELLSNISGGNIRSIIEFVKKFIGNPNVNAQKIVGIMESQSSYLIPLHEFSKAAILGEYSHYSNETSLAFNLFQTGFPDKNEHFLNSIIISFLNWEGPHRIKEGFVPGTAIIDEIQSYGFMPQQIQESLRKLTNKKLVETSERITFKEDICGLIGDLPEYFRATTSGLYHVLRWSGQFVYLDAMVFDTPIYDKKTMDYILPKLESFELNDRLDRVKAFRSYLTKIWNESHIRPSYYNWLDCVTLGEENIKIIEKISIRFNDQN
ncbi:MAG: hypothetical protein KC553_09780 [Nitrospina sp.]|nr:hypothetical protein [Nitrospina sp.]